MYELDSHASLFPINIRPLFFERVWKDVINELAKLELKELAAYLVAEPFQIP